MAAHDCSNAERHMMQKHCNMHRPCSHTPTFFHKTTKSALPSVHPVLQTKPSQLQATVDQASPRAALGQLGHTQREDNGETWREMALRRVGVRESKSQKPEQQLRLLSAWGPP